MNAYTLDELIDIFEELKTNGLLLNDCMSNLIFRLNGASVTADVMVRLDERQFVPSASIDENGDYVLPTGGRGMKGALRLKIESLQRTGEWFFLDASEVKTESYLRSRASIIAKDLKMRVSVKVGVKDGANGYVVTRVG